MLKKFNYEVVTTRHPQDALYTLRLKKGAFDLVLSDVQLPDIDGFELQKAIEQEFHLPVVLMSADCQVGIVTKGLDNGAAFFIHKPVCADDLRDLWRFARTYEKRPITFEEIQSLPAPETSSEKIELKEIITISDSSVEEDIDHAENDLKRKRDQPSENSEVSSSSSPQRPKLAWTNTLNNHFLEAIRTIGLDDAVPGKILNVMGVPGLTRENVASHLQKYRIFLRRVADASLEIPSGRNESSTRRFISRLKSSEYGSSSSILDKFSENNQQNTWRIPDLNLSASTGPTYARILANRGIFRKTNAASSSLVIQDADRSCSGAGESSSNHARPSAENNLPKCDQSVGTSSISVPAELPKSSRHRSNYVGYRLSDLQHLAESGLLQPNSMVMDLTNAEIQGNNIPSSAANLRDERSSFEDIFDKFFADFPPTSSAPDYIKDKQLSAVIANYEKLIADPNPSLQTGVENVDDVLEDDSGSLFDLDEFDFMSTDLSSDGVGTDHTTLPEPATFENEEQAHQDYECQVSQETEATSRLGEAHGSLDEKQATTNTHLSSSQEFNASSHLSNTHLPPTQVDDEELLDSLLVKFPGKNQTSDGI